jgi:GDP-L-fucose synthase
MGNILVTGGSGLIGSEFNNAVKPTRSEFDLTNSAQVDAMYTKYQPEYVITTAAKVGGVLANMNYPANFYDDNILINTNVIKFAQIHNIKKLCCFSSTCIFPDQIEYPLTEDKIHLGAPHRSNFGYAYAKRMASIQIDAYNQQYGTDYFQVIPTNVYGLNDNYNLESGHVIPSLIHRCYLAIKNNTDIIVWGSGKPLREFVFARDVATISSLLLTKDHVGSVIVSSSAEISIKDLVTVICDKMKFKNNIIFDADKPDGQYRKNTDTSKLKKLLGDFNFTSLDHGLEETIDYFMFNYEIIRK